VENRPDAVILIFASMSASIPVTIALALATLPSLQDAATVPLVAKPPIVAPTLPAPAPIASPAAKVRSDDERREARERELRERFLPTVATPEEYRQLAKELGLTPHDCEALDEQLAFAAIQRAELEKKVGRVIAALLPASYRYDPRSNVFDPRYTPELMALYAHGDSMAAAVATIEEPILKVFRNGSEMDRRAPLEEFLLARATLRTPAATRIPGAAIDLRELVHAIVPKIESQTPLATANRRYANELFAALEQRFRTLRAIQSERAALMVQLGPEWHLTKAAEEISEIERALDLLDVREAESEFLLRDLNARWVELLRKNFPQELGLRLPRLWIERTHPEIDEEERILRKLVDTFTSSPLVTPADSTAMMEVLLVTIERLAPLTRAAANSADKALALAMANDPTLVEQRLTHQATTLAVQAKRRAVVRESVRMIDRILASEAVDLRPQLEQTLQTLAALDRADAFTRDGLLNAAAAAGLADPESLEVRAPDAATPEDELQSETNGVDGSSPGDSTRTPSNADRGRSRGSRKRPIP
jgi:hypothetical protein